MIIMDGGIILDMKIQLNKVKAQNFATPTMPPASALRCSRSWVQGAAPATLDFISIPRDHVA